MKSSLILKIDDLIWLKQSTNVYNRFDLFIDLINQAKEERKETIKRGIKISLEPGQVEVSIINLVARWHLNRKTVINFLNGLEKRNLICRVSNKLTTIIKLNCLTEVTDKNKNFRSTNDEKNYQTDSCVSDSTDYLTEVQSPLGKYKLEITEQDRKMCQQVFQMFIDTFPKFSRPDDYNEDVERFIYSIFIIQMKGEWSLLEKYFNSLKSDPLINISLSNSTDNEQCSFKRVFSSHWQEILGV